MANNKYNDIVYIINTANTNGFVRYDVEKNIDSLDMVIGKKYNTYKSLCSSESEKEIVFNFSINNKIINIENINNYDFLGNDKLIPLVNEKALDFLIKLCPNDFEYFDVLITDKLSNKTNNKYKLINILSMVELADKNQSIIEECYVKENIIFGYYIKLFLKNKPIPEGKHIFRDVVNNGITKYVSSKFVEEYTKNNLSGLKFKKLDNSNDYV